MWDVYKTGSLKSSTRKQRGFGDRRRVSGNIKLPNGFKWTKFLRNDENKSELFKYLSQKIALLTNNRKMIYSTLRTDILSSHGSCLREVKQRAPCSHEEADKRMLLHAAQQGHKVVCRKTVDTDVLKFRS